MPYEQDDCCFLILGKEKALLWDTGIGIDHLRPLVEKITDLPVTVLISHDHFDHIGGNAEFDEVWCYDIDQQQFSYGRKSPVRRLMHFNGITGTAFRLLDFK
jgi:glyoxylase-like metal-dependent hydrolase (beta-lactamase superfamily II)